MSPRQQTILMVDDEESLLDIVGSVLEAEGFAAAPADARAVAQVRPSNESFPLFFTWMIRREFADDCPATYSSAPMSTCVPRMRFWESMSFVPDAFESSPVFTQAEFA